MKFTRFTASLLRIAIVLFTLSVNAQTETIYTINGNIGYPRLGHKLGNKIILSNSWGTYWQFDTNTGDLDTLLANFDAQSHQFNSAGLFYVTYVSGTNGKHFVSFIDTLGNQMAPIEINDYSNANPDKYKPRYPTLCNDRYYINGYFNNAHCVWESDGTAAGTQVIFQSNNPILSIQERSDTLLIVEGDTSDYFFHKYTYGQPTQQFATAAKQNFSTSFYSIGNSDEHIYFNAKVSNNVYYTYRINFNNPPELFKDERVGQITFRDSLFTLDMGWDLFLSGTISNPSVLDTIYFEKAIQSPSTSIDYTYGNGYYRMVAVDHGHEIVCLKEDSIYQVGTNVVGPGSAVPVNVNGYVTDGPPNPPVNYYIASDSTLYTVLTNGHDHNYYIYRINGTTSQSLFSVENPEDIREIYEINGFIYWIEGNNQTLMLKRRSLSTALQEQSDQTALSETWYRQFAIGKRTHISYGDIVQIFPQQVQFDPQGSTIIGFTMQEWASECRFVSSDTNTAFQFKGTSVYAKYDPFGNIVWANGIGDPEGIFLQQNKFKVRANGNVVVYGQYFGTAYFDDDSLTVPRAGIFLSELDGNTGAVLWKKTIAKAIFINYFDTDQLALDELGNIYIAASYNGKNTSIGGMNIYSDISPASAIAKFDPAGNVLWAKSIETPGANWEAHIKVMDFDDTFQKLTVVQSEGGYNISSSCEYHDWGYLIQEFDVDGTFIAMQGLTGSDIGAMTVGMRTTDNYFFGMGYFRGGLEAGQFVLQTEPESDCYKNELFGVLYDGTQIAKTSKSNNNTFYPLDGVTTADGFYVLGAKKTKELMILKFSRNAEYIGYKEVHQKTNPFDWGDRLFLDVSNGHIVVLGTNFRRDTLLNVIPFVNTLPSLSILKTTDSGWISGSPWLIDTPISLEDNPETIVYPNPFDDHIDVLFSINDMVCDSYKMTDINGRIVKSGVLSDLQFQTIQLPNLSSGMYLISFQGGDTKITRQVIKY